MAAEVRHLSVSIDRPAAEAYEFLSLPENFAKWASWPAESPQGRAVVRFSEPNRFGVLDHAVELPSGITVYVPLRVVARGSGCELVLTLFRGPDMTDERFAADARRVMRDLHVAKRILEG